MAVWSKTLDCSCYELGHTWDPSCWGATKHIAIHGFIQSFKIYAPVYLLAAILQKKKKDYFLKKLLPEILQSTAFLGTNAFVFIGGFCVWKLLVPKFNILTSSFIPALCGSFIAICIERKKRRGLLAVYLSNLATETVYRMLVSRGIVTPLKNGEVLLFSLVAAVYMYLFKKRNGLAGSVSKGLGFMVGPSESGPRDPRPQALTSSSSKLQSRQVNQMHSQHTSSRRNIPPELLRAVARWRQGLRHRLCKHEHSCVSSAVEQFLALFWRGYLIQGAVKCLGAIPQLFAGRGRPLLKALVHWDNLQFGAFLGSFAGIYKAVSCMLRWVRNKDSEFHGLLAGFLAGWSMICYKSSSIAMYLASKLCEILYFKGIEAGYLPYIKCADIILYTISTSMVFHAAVFEPHNLRPAYWKFLIRLTNGRFGEMNRKLLDVFGTNASKLFPDFYPKYDPRFTNMALAS